MLIYPICALPILTQLLMRIPGTRPEVVAFCVGMITLVTATSLSVLLLMNASWLTRKFSKTWVKALDFAYLTSAIIGGAAFVLREAEPVGSYRGWGVVFVATALAIRCTKTILEVFFERHISEAVDKP